VQVSNRQFTPALVGELSLSLTRQLPHTRVAREWKPRFTASISGMERRTLLTMLGAGVVAAASSMSAGYLIGDRRFLHATTLPSASPTPTESGPPLAVPRHIPSPIPTSTSLLTPPLPRFDSPTAARLARPVGQIFGLPGKGNLVALTVDDGKSAEVISGYAEFIKATGMRVTFFITSSYPAWKQNLELLMPLIESGHLQLANHTARHPSLRTCSDQQIVDELLSCEDFLTTTFGVSGKPYFRPPYGLIDDRVQAIAASVGYSVPVMWYGSLGDSTLLEPWQLKALARQWLTAQRIVIGHANYVTVTNCFYEIQKIIHERRLQPVTLDDVYRRA
jgi:hypothetical protein